MLDQNPTVPPTTDCKYVRTVKQEQDGKLVDLGRQRVDTGGVPCEPRPY